MILNIIQVQKSVYINIKPQKIVQNKHKRKEKKKDEKIPNKDKKK